MADSTANPEPNDDGVGSRAPEASNTLWHGRFAGGPADALKALNDSLPFDRRLYRQDIAGSRAHVAMLADVGILDGAESVAIGRALDVVADELGSDTFEFRAGDEDIHTAVERRATELEPAAAKMHTGRSRNDQVATDLRLWLRDELVDIAGLVVGLQQALADQADNYPDAYLPAYTHLQQAMPVMLGHHLLAHGWALARDVDRLLDARRRTDVSPLGAGALAGSSLPLDPHNSAERLGFGAVFDNSLDAVSDRDFVADALYALALLGVHLSRIGEEAVLWASTEFGFLRLDDGFSTGSSMMPQKKNPDVAELARGKAGRLLGNLTGLLATLKGLPLAYNKDLQEDKEALFDSCDTVRLVLLATTGMLSTATFDVDAMADRASSPYGAATDLAEWLVNQGMPFRHAHAVVGELVRRSLDGEGALGELVAAHPDCGPQAAALFVPGTSVRSRVTHGGGGPEAVAIQRQRFQSRMDAELVALSVFPAE